MSYVMQRVWDAISYPDKTVCVYKTIACVYKTIRTIAARRRAIARTFNYVICHTARVWDAISYLIKLSASTRRFVTIRTIAARRRASTTRFVRTRPTDGRGVPLSHAHMSYNSCMRCYLIPNKTVSYVPLTSAALASAVGASSAVVRVQTRLAPRAATAGACGARSRTTAPDATNRMFLLNDCYLELLYGRCRI